MTSRASMLLLDPWLRLVDWIATWAVRAGGAMMLAAAILVGIEVVLRKALHVSLGGADELSGYAFAIATSWALSYTLLQRAHVRVDALYGRLPVRVCAALDLLALAAVGTFATVLTERAFAVLADSIAFSARATTPLATPLWIPQVLWLAGFVLFLLTIVPLLLRSAVAFASGELATVKRLAGARTLAEDAAMEASHTLALSSGEAAQRR